MLSDAWDDGFEAGLTWHEHTNGIPNDPPVNPYLKDSETESTDTDRLNEIVMRHWAAINGLPDASEGQYGRALDQVVIHDVPWLIAEVLRLRDGEK